MGSICVEDPETGEEVEIEYSITGGYARQTLYSPAEYPEVEFLGDLPAGVDEGRLAEEVLQQEKDYEADAQADDYDDYDDRDDYDDYYG